MKFNNSKIKSKYFWGSTFVIILATLLALHCGNVSEENADNNTIAKSAGSEVSIDDIIVALPPFTCEPLNIINSSLLQDCQVDNDCKAVVQSPCGCGGGGIGLGINKKYLADWYRLSSDQLAGYGQPGKICICTANVTCDPRKMSSKCVNNQCDFNRGLTELNFITFP